MNRSFFRANRSFAHFWAKNEQFARKTDERIPSPGFLRDFKNTDQNNICVSHVLKAKTEEKFF